MVAALHQPRVKRSMRGAVTAALISVSVLMTPLQADAAMAVIDGANLEQNAQQLVTAMKQLEEAKRLYAQANAMRSVLGASGGSPAGALGFGSGISSTLSGMQCLFPTMSGWSIPNGISPNFGSVCSSRRFIDQMFTLPDPKDPNSRNLVGKVDRAAILEQRQTVYREATMNGLALAYQQKNDVPQSTQRVASIAAEAANAPDIHSDLQVTNKLLVAIAEQLIAQRMVMAGLLEAVTAQQMQSVPVNFYGKEAESLVRPASNSDTPFGE